MNFKPSMLIRGAIFGCIMVCCCGLLITKSSAFYLETSGLQSKYSESEPNQKESIQTVINSPDNQEITECRINSKYPKRILKWCGLITHYAQKNDLPPDLIAAVIWQESGGNPSAYSASGAVGLMQIMPKDGLAANFKCVNGPCFANRPTIQQLKEPEYNIKYGTRMLANLVKKHGATREALKAYGPMNVGYSYADKVIGIYKDHSK